MTKAREPNRYVVIKEGGDIFKPTFEQWPVEFTTREAAEHCKRQLKQGHQKSFYDPRDSATSLFVARWGQFP